MCRQLTFLGVGARSVATGRSAIGANVNFVAPGSDDDRAWSIRTYERGVEGETLACGTGAVASAILMTAWGRASRAHQPGHEIWPDV